ncbi:MAG: hypothetical protein HC817_03730 [Saprospiraceae bacterium]|nr:hypothetical protein [Saprospiraceae bacterium]
MKKIIIIILIVYPVFLFAQDPITIGGDNNWFNVLAPRGNFSFQMPQSGYNQRDTLSTLFYSLEIDTLLSLQVHHIGNVHTEMPVSDPVWQQLLNQNGGDTLRAVGAMMLLLTNGTLEGIQNITASGAQPPGIEIGIKYPSEKIAGNDLLISRIYYQAGKFVAFTLTSTEGDAVRLGSYKTSFFNSIYFY